MVRQIVFDSLSEQRQRSPTMTCRDAAVARFCIAPNTGCSLILSILPIFERRAYDVVMKMLKVRPLWKCRVTDEPA